MNWFQDFLEDEDAAVTVDWVVLTGSIVVLGLVVITSITGGAVSHSNSVGAHLSQRSVGAPAG